MRVLLTGATGFVGLSLCEQLLRQGHQLTVLTRKKEDWSARFPYPAKSFAWDHKSEIPRAVFADKVDAIVHLAGEPVIGRWSEKKKKRILDSRVLSSNAINRSLHALPEEKRPKILVSASGSGFYGDTGDELRDEMADVGQSFLAKVCEKWEGSLVQGLSELGVRCVQLRTGLVLGDSGGAFLKFKNLARFGCLGVLGSGRQWVSWIHLKDLVQLYIWALEQNINGPINAVSPEPVRHREMIRSINKSFSRWTPPGMPSLPLKILAGEMSALFLESQRLVPTQALEKQFAFCYRDLEAALVDLSAGGLDNEIQSAQWFSSSQEEVFDFFSNEKNLEVITPEFLNFRVLGKSTEEIEENTKIDYKLSLRGLPMRWQSLISVWQKGQYFVDEQLKGPYSKWHHEHRFESFAQGTLVKDRVRYRLPLGLFGELFAGAFVRRDVGAIFRYRREALSKIFT